MVIGTQIQMDVPFDSTGEAPLWLAPPPQNDTLYWPVQEVTIPQGTTGAIPVIFAPTVPGMVQYRLPFRTNDPDSPQVWVSFRGTGVEPAPDAGVLEEMLVLGGQDGLDQEWGNVLVVDGGALLLAEFVDEPAVAAIDLKRNLDLDVAQLRGLRQPWRNVVVDADQ